MSIEDGLGEAAWTCTPREVRVLGRELLTAADVDGPEPEDRPGRNVLSVHANPDGTGSIHGVFDDAGAFAAIRTVLDARTRPIEVNRGTTIAERNAAALVEVCRFALDHQDHGEVQGERPHLTVTIVLKDLEARARGAVLAMGGELTPAQLHRLACDAEAIPVVLGEAGEPLDVGRASRIVPTRTRRAAAARDRGCAHPGWRIDMSTGIPRFIPPDWLAELKAAA